MPQKEDKNMSKFNKYAKELESITFEAVKKLKEAEEKERQTKEALDRHPEKKGFVDLAYDIEYQRRKLAHDEATENLRIIRASVPNELSKATKEIRSRLKADADYYFAVDPKQLQPEVMSFLESGMLNVNDYTKLMKVAISDNNVTMIRMIADRAKKAADTVGNDRDRLSLLAISDEASLYTTESYLAAFDSIASVSETCMHNTRVADHWNTDLGINKVVEAF